MSSLETNILESQTQISLCVRDDILTSVQVLCAKEFDSLKQYCYMEEVSVYWESTPGILPQRIKFGPISFLEPYHVRDLIHAGKFSQESFSLQTISAARMKFDEDEFYVSIHDSAIEYEDAYAKYIADSLKIAYFHPHELCIASLIRTGEL